MLAGYCRDLAHFSKLAGREKDQAYFSAESEKIFSNVNKHLFDKKKGLYYDYNWATQRRSKVTTAASFFPFYFESYRKDEVAKKHLLQLLRSLKLRGDLAIRTTEREGKGQWDGAWTWAPLNEIAFQALMKYGLEKEADQLAFDFSLMVITTFYRHDHRFYEKHRVDTNSIEIPKDSEIYGNEEGFGRTNGVLSQFLSHLTKSGRIQELEMAIQHRLKHN
jgi:alpha,alpha-trehalase